MKKKKYYRNRCIDEVATKIQNECKRLHSQLFNGKKTVDLNSVKDAENYLSNLTHGIFHFKLTEKNVIIRLVGAEGKVFMSKRCSIETIASKFKSINHYFQPEEFKNEKDPEFHKRFYLYRCDREGQNCLL